MGWAVGRGALYSGGVPVRDGGPRGRLDRWVVLCYPSAILISFAFAGAGMAGTTFMRCWQDFDMVSLAILPMFLFSGIFYPLTVYPGWLQLVVRCTPLYQGVALMRGLDLGLFGWPLLGHVAVPGGDGAGRPDAHVPAAGQAGAAVGGVGVGSDRTSQRKRGLRRSPWREDWRVRWRS